MTIAKSVALFVLAAIAEIGGAWLVWQGWREHRGLWWIAAGILALGAYGFVGSFQPDPYYGRILAAYGGVFVAGSLAWGMLLDGFRPRQMGPHRRRDLPDRRRRDHVRPEERVMSTALGLVANKAVATAVTTLLEPGPWPTAT
jgi:small multidrug resistance family-3 protein